MPVANQDHFGCCAMATTRSGTSAFASTFSTWLSARTAFSGASSMPRGWGSSGRSSRPSKGGKWTCSRFGFSSMASRASSSVSCTKQFNSSPEDERTRAIRSSGSDDISLWAGQPKRFPYGGLRRRDIDRYQAPLWHRRFQLPFNGGIEILRAPVHAADSCNPHLPIPPAELVRNTCREFRERHGSGRKYLTGHGVLLISEVCDERICFWENVVGIPCDAIKQGIPAMTLVACENPRGNLGGRTTI